MRILYNILNDRTFVKFVLVGVLNTAFGYSLFALLIYAGLHYVIATFLATVLGILFNFKTIGLLVFKSSDHSLVIKFAGVYFVTYCINIASLRILTSLNINVYVSGLVLIVPIAVITYLLQKHLVFAKKDHSEAS